MKLIGNMLKNELLSLSTIFLVLVPMLNHVMMAHGAPDVSNLAGTLTHFASQASTAGFSLAQAGTGESALYISHGPIFLN